MAKYTNNLNLLKPELTDAPPDITTLNQNWDTLDTELFNAINKSQLHTYTSLTQIGLSGAVTMEQVCVALPDCSMLVHGNSIGDASGNYISDVPHEFGTVEIVRYNVSRVFALFVRSDGEVVQMYVGKYHGSTGWVGWLDVSAVPTPEAIGALALKPKFIEFMPDANASNGGYIDFHYNGSTEDFTSRILESESGRLAIEAPNGVAVSDNLRVNGELRIPDVADTSKGSRMYTSDGLGLSYMTDATDNNSARTGLKINVPSEELDTLIRVFIATVAGDAKWYNLFGEHNVDMLRSNLFTASTSDITAGSTALTSGKLYLVYE